MMPRSADPHFWSVRLFPGKTPHTSKAGARHSMRERQSQEGLHTFKYEGLHYACSSESFLTLKSDSIPFEDAFESNSSGRLCESQREAFTAGPLNSHDLNSELHSQDSDSAKGADISAKNTHSCAKLREIQKKCRTFFRANCPCAFCFHIHSRFDLHF
jgi:hypothetical protein